MLDLENILKNYSKDGIYRGMVEKMDQKNWAFTFSVFIQEENHPSLAASNKKVALSKIKLLPKEATDVGFF